MVPHKSNWINNYINFLYRVSTWNSERDQRRSDLFLYKEKLDGGRRKVLNYLAAFHYCVLWRKIMVHLELTLSVRACPSVNLPLSSARMLKLTFPFLSCKIWWSLSESSSFPKPTVLSCLRRDHFKASKRRFDPGGNAAPKGSIACILSAIPECTAISTVENHQDLFLKHGEKTLF